MVLYRKVIKNDKVFEQLLSGSFNLRTVVDRPGAVCMLILILLSWEELWTRSESYSRDIL